MNLRLAVSILFFLSLYLHANAYNDRETRRQTGLKRRSELNPIIYPQKKKQPMPKQAFVDKEPVLSIYSKRRASPSRTPPRKYPAKRRAATFINARRPSNTKAQLRRSNAERKTLNAVRRLMPPGRKLPARKANTIRVITPSPLSRRTNIDDDEFDSIIDNILRYIFSHIQKVIPTTDDDKIIAPDEKTLQESFDKLLQVIFDEIEKSTKSSGNTRRMNNAGPISRRSFSQTPMRRSDNDDEELDTAIDTILRLFFSEFQKMNITSCLGTGDDDVIAAPTEEELDSALDYVLELVYAELQNHNLVPKEENRRVFRNNNLSRRSEINADNINIAVENILKFIFSEIQKHNDAILQSTGEEKISAPDETELQASFEVILKLILDQVGGAKNKNDGIGRRMNTRRSDFNDISEEELDGAIESILKLIFSEIQKHNISSCFGLDPNDETITPPSDEDLDTALDNILNLIFHELQKHNIIPTEGNNRRMKEVDASEPTTSIFGKIYNYLFKKAEPAAATIVENSKDDGESRRMESGIGDEKFGGSMDKVIKLLFQELGKLKG